MGHAEMILAVAGMKPDEVAAATRRLAGDGSGLSAAEKAAFAFARKQSGDPASVSDADVQELERQFGRDRAWQVVWWASRCHYMTRVADAFQLPLERDNPFEEMPGVRKGK
jgi:hypothetical protein